MKHVILKADGEKREGTMKEEVGLVLKMTSVAYGKIDKMMDSYIVALKQEMGKRSVKT